MVEREPLLPDVPRVAVAHEKRGDVCVARDVEEIPLTQQGELLHIVRPPFPDCFSFFEMVFFPSITVLSLGGLGVVGNMACRGA